VHSVISEDNFTTAAILAMERVALQNTNHKPTKDFVAKEISKKHV
jgi:hypothetical protein